MNSPGWFSPPIPTIGKFTPYLKIRASGCAGKMMNNDVKPFLVPETNTIRQAMEQLEKTEEKIIFVVDAASRLVGSLTDGDIRRWILADGDLKAPVINVCNRKPYIAPEGYRLEEVRADMLKGNFGCVPGSQFLSRDPAPAVLEGNI